MLVQMRLGDTPLDLVENYVNPFRGAPAHPPDTMERTFNVIYVDMPDPEAPVVVWAIHHVRVHYAAGRAQHIDHGQFTRGPVAPQAENFSQVVPAVPRHIPGQ